MYKVYEPLTFHCENTDHHQREQIFQQNLLDNKKFEFILLLRGCSFENQRNFQMKGDTNLNSFYFQSDEGQNKKKTPQYRD
jgi:hypothetical protein